MVGNGRFDTCLSSFVPDVVSDRCAAPAGGTKPAGSAPLEEILDLDTLFTRCAALACGKKPVGSAPLVDTLHVTVNPGAHMCQSSYGFTIGLLN